MRTERMDHCKGDGMLAEIVMVHIATLQFHMYKTIQSQRVISR
jgi:hypothetical protein